VDEAAGREVAVKVLRARSAGDDRPGSGLAFATVAALSGPGIAQVHHYGEEPASEGRPAVRYVVRDLVPGPTLEERLARGSLPAAEALRFVASVADALAAAHGAGVVHGNLVPANVIDGPAGVKVTDFGLSALRDRLPGERFQSVLSYAAPERLSGGPATTASDMYSLGVLFVACLSGIAAAGTSGSPPVADPAADPVTPGLAALWAACLGASPRERPSAAHVAFMSRQALAARPAAAAGAEAEPGQPASMAEPGRGAAGQGAAGRGTGRGVAGQGTAAGGVAGGRDDPVPVGRWVRDGGPGPAGGPGDRGPGRAGHSGPGRGRGTGARSRRAPRDRPGVAGRGRLLALGAAAVTGAAVAAVVLTQFLTSPSAQTTGASPTPAAHATTSFRAPRPSRSAGQPLPSADATSSVLASFSPPPAQVLGQMQATIRRGVASGQIRQDVGVDLDNLIQPVQTDLAAGSTAGVPQLVTALKAKLAARLGEGAISRAADAELSRELATLLRSVTGR
jgi:eukaryotic-like serine/threonine-protein kinase